jgi:tetratricopeptide (TPR) repeat protein
MASIFNYIAVRRLYSRDEETKPLGETLLLLRQALSIHANALRCADISENTSGPMALAKATIINNIGRALYQQEYFSRALSMHTEASDMRKALQEKDHIDVAVSFYNMANAHCCLGNDSEGISGYDTYVSIASLHLGCDHPDIASVLTIVGQLYYEMNDCLRAIKYISRALNSSVFAYSKMDIKVAIVYNILGSASFEAGYLDIAL